MKKILMTLLFILFLMICESACAAELDGTWTCLFIGPMRGMEAVLKIENGNFQVSVKDKVLDEGTLRISDGKLHVKSTITGNWRCDIRIAPSGRAFTLVYQPVELEYRKTN